jgi:anti-sigma regulatory factor (Ser/Thr protein kinase)
VLYFPQPRMPGELTSCLDLAALSAAPFWARHQTRIVLQSWQVLAEDIDTAVLLVSELITNAVKFTGTDPARVGHADLHSAAPISLILRYMTGQLIIEVADAKPAPPMLSCPDNDAESGRGLMLVQALSKEWGHHLPLSGGKVVYCILAA